MESAWAYLILTVAWAIREIVPALIRKHKGYQGFLYSLPPPPEDADTARETPRAKRRWFR
jgi:hypothetical protein